MHGCARHICVVTIADRQSPERKKFWMHEIRLNIKEESGLSLSYDHDNHRQRYNKTQNIISHGFASHYVLAAMLVKKSWELGYCWYSLLGCCADGSFVAYLMDISKPIHFRRTFIVPKCKRVKFVDAKQYPSGFDLDGFGAEPPICPQCGERLVGDGHNIPVEFFAGYQELSAALC